VFKTRFYKYFIPALLIVILPFAGKTSFTGLNPPGHIVFIENSWDDALKQAHEQNKYIFVDAYTSWCGPCMMLKNQTFANKKAADFYNANFINLSLDIEKGAGPQFAVKWQIKSIPTLIIFDTKGKPVLGTVGFVSADDLIRFGKQALGK
jgi:thioredoxin 1